MRSNQARAEVIEEVVIPAPPAKGDIHVLAAVKAESVMDPRVYKVALGCWIGFLCVFWVTFWANASALFMVVVGTVYAAMFFGVPYAMSRQVRDRPATDRPFAAFLRAPFATLNGTMRGGEALLQVILVPLCLICGGIAIGIIIRAARIAP